jgi:type VI secretion system secreted protein Hcp
MKKTVLVRTMVAAALVLSAAAAVAASDYLLEIKGISGDSGASDAPKTIEIASWSWGASNPTSVGSGGLSAGRAAAPRMGDVATLVVMYRESPTRASTGATAAKQGGCATGTHFGNVVLTGKGSRYEMTDVTVVSCTDMGSGMRQRELRGHVTLIK